MKRFLVRLEEGSGMEINPRKFWVNAEDGKEALRKALQLDGFYNNGEIEDFISSGYESNNYDDSFVAEIDCVDEQEYK